MSGLTPIQKYEQFVNAHPLYKNMSISNVASIMLKQGVITLLESDVLKQSVFTNNSTKSESEFGYGAFGLELSTKKNDSAPPVRIPEKIKNYHPILAGVEVDDNGNVDLNRFTFEALKSEYDSKIYDVKKDEQGAVVVSKKDGTPVLKVVDIEVFNEKSVTFFKDSGNSDFLRFSSKNGEISLYSVTSVENGVEISKSYDGKNLFPSSITEKYQNGDRKSLQYNRTTGKPEFQDYWKKDGNSAEWFIKYSDGKPYKKQNGYSDKNPEFILVKDLKEDIYAKNKLGLPTTRSSLSENVLKRITNENVVETIIQYKKQTGNELIEDIGNEVGINPKLKNQLISHIEKLYLNNADSAELGIFIASRIHDDITGLGSGNIEEHINLITNDNLKYVLQVYIGAHLGEDVREQRKGLLTEIYDEIGLGDKRQQIINKLISVATENLNETVKQDILNDIASHKNEPYLIEKDLMRALEITSGGDLRNPNNQTEISKPNGKFDGQIKQGRIGDCWLVSSVISLAQKEHGKKLLESAIKLDSKTGDAVVTLKGYNKTYTIPAALIQDSNYLSSGDGDMRIIELAMDKYLKEKAYKRGVPNTFNSYDNININGENESTLYAAFGKVVSDSYKDGIMSRDFNDKNTYYSFALPSFGGYEPLESIAIDSNGEKADIQIDHAYAIIGSDKDNIYFINPWDSDNILTISRKDFDNHHIWVSSYKYED